MDAYTKETRFGTKVAVGMRMMRNVQKAHDATLDEN